MIVLRRMKMIAVSLWVWGISETQQREIVTVVMKMCSAGHQGTAVLLLGGCPGVSAALRLQGGSHKE